MMDLRVPLNDPPSMKRQLKPEVKSVGKVDENAKTIYLKENLVLGLVVQLRGLRRVLCTFINYVL